MIGSLRHTAALLALAAMLLRAAIPAGWMPAAQGSGLLTLCTANGLVQIESSLADTPSSPHAPTADSQFHCPFGALATPVLPSANLALSGFDAANTPTAGVMPDRRVFLPERAHRARAPPTALSA